MTQEDKDLLLKDLCARIPYKIKCEVYNRVGILIEVNEYGFAVTYDGGLEETTCQINNIKPYLFPMSSMTEEQKIIYGDFVYEIVSSNLLETQKCISNLHDWLNKNHFDYRGLIPMGLGIDATGLNIYV